MRTKDESKFADIIRFVNDYYKDNGRSPSTREIGKEVGISYSMVSRYLAELCERGLISCDGHRGIVTEYIRDLVLSASVSTGGTIPCGPPTELCDYQTECICMPRELTGNGRFHLLTASGDSMINAGINNGDRVLIRLTPVANRGDIVACLYDGDKTTLKRYLPEKDEIILMPENEEYEPIHIVGKNREKLIIQGVATMVMKQL